MVKWKLIILITIIIEMSCFNSNDNQIQRLDGTTIRENQLDEKINSLIEKASVTGLAVSIFHCDKVSYQKAFGYSNFETKDSLDIDHIFYGASLSKSVFAYLVAQLVNEGKIDLDKPLNSYFDVELPDIIIEKEWRRLHDLRKDERYKKFTTRMCLSHSTGLPNWRWINNPDEKLRIHFDPGTNHSYSGEGIMLAQWLVEHITNEKLEDIAMNKIFEPLKMKNTDYLWRNDFKNHFCYGHSKKQEKLPKDIETEDAAAAGSMETTIVDFTIFLQHILKLCKSNSEISKNLFSPAIRIKSKAQFGPLAKEATSEYDNIELSYGLGWALLKSPYGFGAGRGGHSEGFQHYSIIFPEKGIGVALMSNSDNAEGVFKELLEITIADTFTPWKWKGYIPYKLNE